MNLLSKRMNEVIKIGKLMKEDRLKIYCIDGKIKAVVENQHVKYNCVIGSEATGNQFCFVVYIKDLESVMKKKDSVLAGELTDTYFSIGSSRIKIIDKFAETDTDGWCDHLINDEGDYYSHCKLINGDLLKALTNSLISVAKPDFERFIFQCVNFKIYPEYINSRATDTHRLSTCDIPVHNAEFKEQEDGFKLLTIPYPEALKAMLALKTEFKWVFSFNDLYAEFKSPEREFFIKNYKEIDYPNLEKITEQSFDAFSLKLSKSELLEAVNELMPIAKENTYRITMTFIQEEKKIILKSEYDSATSETIISASGEFPLFRHQGINAKYLLELLNTFYKDLNTVVMRGKNSFQAPILFDTIKTNDIQVIMPMAIDIDLENENREIEEKSEDDE